MSRPDREVLRTLIRVQGIVQGVGFRPTVYRYARDNSLTGYVLNDSEGVEIELVGEAEAIDRFIAALQDAPPPLARIDSLSVLVREVAPSPTPAEFGIVPSRSAERGATLISPDIATCEDCVAEMGDPGDRRFGHPFLNCTNCGPRYTIIEDVPYDRPMTTMRDFVRCHRCEEEYTDPLDRRFHAQPTCCPECGPGLSLLDDRGVAVDNAEPVAATLDQLARGGIVAVKGLGGFHLACDGANDRAVAELRRRKGRDEKPFAVMARSLDDVREFARLSGAESLLLSSRERPIVLLEKREPFPLAHGVAPNNRWIGVMLPYTPLHHLLLKSGEPALVMTSANISDEPIVKSNAEALERLGGIADLYLVHNREILIRADDSVVRAQEGRAVHLRRSRGYVPVPIDLGAAPPPVLAVGGELKNTVCLTRGRDAFVSQHIGDLEDERNYGFFQETIAHLGKVLSVRPELVVHDLHPDYLSTRFAGELEGVERVQVQHHHAHILSCLAEHRLREPVIGLSLDGTGFGTDGTIWGGEILAVDGRRSVRLGHFKPLPLPGGEAAIRQPWRMALAMLMDAFGGVDPAWAKLFPWLARPEAAKLSALLLKSYPFVRSSGAGRVFEAVSALLGVREVNTFEGQAAMELEMAAGKGRGLRPFDVQLEGRDGEPWVIDFAPTVRQLVEARLNGEERELLATRFHATVGHSLLSAVEKAGQETGLSVVALSGGVFQNQLLTSALARDLGARGLTVYRHSLVPPNDGGLSLGQAYYCTFPDNST